MRLGLVKRNGGKQSDRSGERRAGAARFRREGYSRNRWFGVLAVALVAIMQGLAGCASREPNRLALDAPSPGMHGFFVVSHGYHSGLAVRARDVPEGAWPARRDFPDAEFLVMGWGERE